HAVSGHLVDLFPRRRDDSVSIRQYMIHREQPRPLPPNYKGTAYEFKKFYYDTAQVYDADEMRLAKSLWSTSHSVFGSDFRYFSSAETVEGVKNCGVFDKTELQAIYYENLHRLVPRLRSLYPEKGNADAMTKSLGLLF